jgi:hypothetical protein
LLYIQDDYDFWQHGKGAQADKLKLALNKGRGVHEYIDSDKEETPKSGKSEPAMVAAYPFSSDPLQQVRERPASINSQQGICQAFPKVDGRLLDLMLKVCVLRPSLTSLWLSGATCTWQCHMFCWLVGKHAY